MNANVKGALSARIAAGDWSNPALRTLVQAYVLYHAILVLSASGVALACCVTAVLLVRRRGQIRQDSRVGAKFARGTYLSLASISGVAAVALAALAAINASNVFDAHEGFRIAVAALPTPGPGSPLVPLYASLTSWIQSGSWAVPIQVQQSEQARVDFQAPKAIISELLLVTTLVTSGVLWRTLLRRSTVRAITWNPQDAVLRLPAIVAILFAFPLLVIALANLQSALAPLALTLAFG